VPTAAVNPSPAPQTAEHSKTHKDVPPLPLAGVVASRGATAPSSSRSEEDWLDRYMKELGHLPHSAVQLQAFAVSQGHRVPFGKAVKLLSGHRTGANSKGRGGSKQAQMQRAKQAPSSKSPRPTAVQAPPSMSPRSTAVQAVAQLQVAPLSMSPHPTAVQVPLSNSSCPRAVQAPLSNCSFPTTVQVPVSNSPCPAAVQVPLRSSSRSSRPTAVQVPLRSSSRPTAVQAPLPNSSRPTVAQVDLLKTPRATSLHRMQEGKEPEPSTCCEPPPFAPWITLNVAGLSETEQKGDSDEPDFAINTPTGSEFEALISSRWEPGFDPARSPSRGHPGLVGALCPPPSQGLHWQNGLRCPLMNFTESLPVARQEGPGRPAQEARAFCAATAAAKAFLATQPERPVSLAVLHARAVAGEAGGREAISSACHTTAEMPLPSRGSALHSVGTCRPCAFVHQEGCRSGANCEFCHLCDAGARRRLRRERLRRARAARAAAR